MGFIIKQQRVIRNSILFITFILLNSSISARIFFLGKITEADPKLNIVVVKGEPVENVQVGQIYDIVLGDQIYGKAKVLYVDTDGFDARVVEGSVQEIYEIQNGEGERVAAAGFNDFLVIEVEEQQTAVMVFKSGRIEKITLLEQSKEGFKVKTSSGAEMLVTSADLQKILYEEEAEYYKYVKKDNLLASNLPGEREREDARILDAKKKLKFEDAIRLAMDYILSGKFAEALKLTDRAIKIKPSNYEGYFVKGQALMKVKKTIFAIAMFENALKYDKGINKAEIEYQLALAHREAGNKLEAKKYLENAVDHGKKDFDTSHLLAEIQLEAGNFNDALSTSIWALKNMKKGTELSKARLHAMAATLYLDKQYNIEQAAAQATLAMQIAPNDPAVKKIHNRILIERSKTIEKEVVDLSIIGGAWKTSNGKLYINYLEETVTIIVFRVDPVTSKLAVIIIGGDMRTNTDEGLVIVENPKTQKFPIGAAKQLKYSQIKKLRDLFFSGEEETTEIDSDIAFKVIDFNPLKLKVLLDGNQYDMVPMDMEE